MNAIDRIKQYIENKGLNNSSFEKKIGLSNGYIGTQLKRNASLGEDIMNKILDNCLDINPAWLLTGKGEMLIEKKKEDPLKEAERLELINKYTEKLRKEEGGLIEQRYPLVNATAIGGFGNSKFAIEERDVKDYYVIPKFKHKQIDFMIEVEGSSMYPKYNSGDVVACRIINEKNFIQWNKTHVVATRDQGIIIKRIKPGTSESVFRMVSDNKDYDPFEIHTDDISGVALVVGVIRLE